MWNRPDVDFIQTQDVPTAWAAQGTFGAAGGGIKRVLSEDLADGAQTFLLQVQDHQLGHLTADVDLYVVSGEGVLGGESLRTGDYVYLPAGSPVDLRPAVTGLTLYCGFWGFPTWATEPLEATGDVLRVRPDLVQWETALWSGETPLEPGVAVKSLRKADGVFIYLAAMMPGWKCEMEESHPVYEESFKITGDTLMGARGVIRRHGYFYRGPDVFHGPLYSRGGTMSFIRSNAPTTTEYRVPPASGTWDVLAHQAYGE